jgi:glycine cleavage system H lipoate-binding protein
MIEQVNDGKKPCIWMEAGVVDFKLCHHCFDCATCEFDRAMSAVAAQELSLREACELAAGHPARVLPLRERLRRRSFEELLEDQGECYTGLERPRITEVFGFKAPTSIYLHRGHTWVAMEACGRVRLGLDDFIQKVLGPADAIKLPAAGETWQRGKVGLTLVRKGKEAPVPAPLDGVVEVVNSKIRQRAALAHDDPYGEGWLCVVTPTNLQPDLEKLLFGRRNAAWIENETHKLLGMMESSAGATLNTGGTVIGDIFGTHPQLGWENLVREFLRTI